MGWVKEANKIGKYRSIHYGFRIYYLVEPTVNERIETREDGDYRITKFTRGEYLAIDKTGLKIQGDIDRVHAAIDKEELRRQMSRKYREELIWK